MTDKEKAKAYDEAIERGKQIQTTTYTAHWDIMKEVAEHLLPELKEGESERIRKELIQYLKECNNLPNGQYCRADFFAWLERQGEQKSIDKVEPKFNKGDILYEQITMSILLVYERNGSWLMTFCDYWMLKEKFHVVLPYEDYGFVREMSLVPATKEQRDLLFKKMHDAGYEWDAEKKELKKIEQNHVIEMKTPEESLGIDSDTYNKIVDECVYGEQKPAWSKEDEVMLDEIIDFFENGTVKLQHDLLLYASWLKSLKDKYTWKPSEEMLEALYRVIPENVMEKSEDEMLLDKLYQGLKYSRVLSEK